MVGKSFRPEDRVGYSPETMPTFCRRVRERRLSLGMTLEQLGKKIRMRGSDVSRMESGKLPRDEWRIVAIAKALGVSLDWLFGLVD